LGQIPAAIELIDRSRYLLKSAETAHLQIQPNIKVKKLQAQIGDVKAHKTIQKILDIALKNHQPLWIGFSYVWNELQRQPQSFKSSLKLINEFSNSQLPILLFIAEPGRENEAREILDLREFLIKKDFEIVYPCPKSETCPMLQDGRDWCYSEILNHQTSDWKPIGQFLRLKRDKLSTASLILINKAYKQKFKNLTKNKSTIVGNITFNNHANWLVCDGKDITKQPAREEKLKGEGL